VPLSNGNAFNQPPPGFILHKEFVSQELEQELLACVDWDDANGLFTFRAEIYYLPPPPLVYLFYTSWYFRFIQQHTTVYQGSACTFVWCEGLTKIFKNAKETQILRGISYFGGEGNFPQLKGGTTTGAGGVMHPHLFHI